ncbi:MAG: low molecular weight phosphotyrosine protein phosphatase, partial [Victivallales bacterium]|nr:low molecular weight phosphotyrosine protein phosphatase [Victivallales bacterium]
MDWTNIHNLMFICHGNICRSPLAESLMTHLLAKAAIRNVFCASAATSTEEIGNGVHPGTRSVLRQHGIPLVPHRAVQLHRDDLPAYDLFLGMDTPNVRNIIRILGPDAIPKTFRLLDFT